MTLYQSGTLGGGVNLFYGSYAYYVKVVPSVSGTLLSLEISVAANGYGGNITLGIYSDSGSNSPSTLLASITPTTFATSGVLTVSAGLTGIAITAGTTYWLAFYSNSGSGPAFNTNTTSITCGYQTPESGLPSTATMTSGSNNIWMAMNVLVALAPITLVSHTQISGATGGTTSGINTLGASLIVLNAAFLSSSTPTPTDSLGNTWTPLTSQTYSATQYNQLFYCLNPNVGASHTFSTTGTTSALEVAAFSNVLGFDVQNGNQGIADPISTGSVSPTNNFSLVVSGINFGVAGSTSINTGFTITDQNNFSAGVNYGGALAYLIQTVKGAVNPNWTLGGGGSATTIAVFTNGSAQQSDPTPSLQRLLIQNDNAYQDPIVDDDQTAKTLTSWRKNQVTTWTKPNTSIAKFIQYDVIAPPIAINVAKFVQYDVISPPVALNVAKFVQYTVLDSPYTGKTAYTPSIRYSNFFQNKPSKNNKRIRGFPLGRRLYNFIIT
jgi:hypothetical protein